MSKLPLNQLNLIVDAVFQRYDINRNGFLEFNQIYTMLVDSFKKLNRWRNVEQADIKALIGISNRRSKDRLNRDDVAQIFKKALSV